MDEEEFMKIIIRQKGRRKDGSGTEPLILLQASLDDVVKAGTPCSRGRWAIQTGAAGQTNELTEPVRDV